MICGKEWKVPMETTFLWSLEITHDFSSLTKQIFVRMLIAEEVCTVATCHRNVEIFFKCIENQK